MAAMDLDERPKPEKSPLGEVLDSGVAKIGGTERKIVKATRKTDAGKLAAAEKEKLRQKDAALFQATLKKKSEMVKENDSDDSDDWEDVEEDFPHVKLEELLDNLKIDDGTGIEEFK